MAADISQLKMPKSIAHWSDPFISGAAIYAMYMGLRDSTLSNNEMAMVMVGGLTLLLCGIELLRAPWHDTPRPDVPFRDVLNSAAVKWVGSMTGFAITLFGWWLLQEYQRNQYQPLFFALNLAFPYIPIVVFLTHLFTEWRLGPSDGDGRDLGLFTLLRWKEMDGNGIRDELLTWFIKGFFFTINLSEIPKALSNFRGKEDQIMNMPWPELQGMLILLLYCFIIIAIAPGYLFSARIFGTHIRNIATSWFAYTVTLCCYAPFVGGVFNRWFNSHPISPDPDWNKPWVSNFHDDPTMLYIIGGTIVLSEFIHYWGESIFGLRSSNLCHRGIITAGPFRYCKHPVFAAKCFSWLLIWMPFISGNTVVECIRLTLCWLGVCIVFGARCWAEERVLAQDKDYVAYALWVDKHGIFSVPANFIPVLQFRWRLKRWIRRGEISADVLPAGYVL
jgi:hypothetical protein